MIAQVVKWKLHLTVNGVRRVFLFSFNSGILTKQSPLSLDTDAISADFSPSDKTETDLPRRLLTEKINKNGSQERKLRVW